MVETELLWLCSKRSLTSRDFIFKNAKIKSSSMIMNTHQGHMTWYSNSNLSHMLLVWALSYVKLLWPVLRFSSCAHDQDTRTPTNKLLTLTLRVTQKHAFFVHQIITPFIYHVSLSQRFSYAKKNSMGYAKKRRKRKKYPCQKAWEKKICIPKSMKKKTEKK